jgi:hypothetical protein
MHTAYLLGSLGHAQHAQHSDHSWQVALHVAMHSAGLCLHSTAEDSPRLPPGV